VETDFACLAGQLETEKLQERVERERAQERERHWERERAAWSEEKDRLGQVLKDLQSKQAVLAHQKEEKEALRVRERMRSEQREREHREAEEQTVRALEAEVRAKELANQEVVKILLANQENARELSLQLVSTRKCRFADQQTLQRVAAEVSRLLQLVAGQHCVPAVMPHHTVPCKSPRARHIVD
jgi:hypothetical protein